ncbi:hypothetical protein BCR36DRAFT_414657 [Piromyces finnis]|uniref:Cilia- and flagella-associated protein 45 n=1 Tax=Piromyces finnis TaxID=1754191 RepID=A0A1Y1V1M5_9FUNG|nr:hypothetical protein BCR36DRAFT_414657 [Piromyces finnis]|eukprot:ORX45203.1 hypothetical protein BCR36DRAFT_414657 [Piromyces finnis]
MPIIDPYRNKKQKSKKIMIITNDNIRTLKPHDVCHISYNPNYDNIIDLKEFRRIQNEAVVITEEEKEKRKQKLMDERIRKTNIARERKQYIDELDQKKNYQKKDEQNGLDSNKKKRSQSNFLDILREEQSDEIKYLNELVLITKCQTIRDLQIEEKKYIENKKKKEDERMNYIIEAHRLKEVQKENEAEEKRLRDIKNGANILKQQIEEREVQRIINQEKNDQEGKALRQIFEKIRKDTIASKIEKEKEKRQRLYELQQENIELIRRKKEQQKKEEEEELKILEYIKEKDLKDKEMEEKKKKEKRDKEIQFRKLLQNQLVEIERRNKAEKLRNQRKVEEDEREWRRKEKEDALKKLRAHEEMKEELIKQRKEREKVIAIESAKLKKEFYENLKKQRLEDELEKEKERKLLEKRLQYTRDIKAQIKEKEDQLKKERQDQYKEAMKLNAERLERNSRLEQIKAQKINELRTLGVSDVLCSFIDRKYTAQKKLFDFGQASQAS